MHWCSSGHNFYFLFFNHQDVTENSSDPVLDLHMSLEELYAQNLLQRRDESPPSVDLSMGTASGFTINDYTPASAIEQQYGCDNTRVWTEPHRPNEVISSAELSSPVLTDSAGKVTFSRDGLCMMMRLGIVRGSIILAHLEPALSWYWDFQKTTYELVLFVGSCWIKHNQLENIGDVEIMLQSLVFLSTWLIFIFWQGSKFLIQQGSLASAAECVMLQTISKESFERTITIAKGNSSLGKFLIFHIHLSSQTPGQEEILNIVSMFLSIDKIIDVVKFPIGFFLSI